ncbi:MAG: hypothetical protein JOZ08_10430 [Verrucomicrobia bacterium]|nr:hypothetical protein [Verrucomicrobiota bacterium]
MKTPLIQACNANVCRGSISLRPITLLGLTELAVEGYTDRFIVATGTPRIWMKLRSANTWTEPIEA